MPICLYGGLQWRKGKCYLWSWEVLTCTAETNVVLAEPGGGDLAQKHSRVGPHPPPLVLPTGWLAMLGVGEAWAGQCHKPCSGGDALGTAGGTSSWEEIVAWKKSDFSSELFCTKLCLEDDANWIWLHDFTHKEINGFLILLNAGALGESLILAGVSNTAAEVSL